MTVRLTDAEFESLIERIDAAHFDVFFRIIQEARRARETEKAERDRAAQLSAALRDIVNAPIGTPEFELRDMARAAQSRHGVPTAPAKREGSGTTD